MAWENFLQKNGVIIDRNQIAIEFNAFFKYAGPKLASKFPNSQRPFKVLLKIDKEILSFYFPLIKSKEAFFVKTNKTRGYDGIRLIFQWHPVVSSMR